MTVEPGTRFVKVDFPDDVWVVVRPLESPDLPLHWQMVNERHTHQRLTISASALCDASLYRQL